jgi:solute carrier family 25 protein 16
MTAGNLPAMTPRAPARDPTICPTDDEAIIPKLNKQSWEYIVKSGVAGGVAGCAVCLPFP